MAKAGSGASFLGSTTQPSRDAGCGVTWQTLGHTQPLLGAHMPGDVAAPGGAGEGAAPGDTTPPQ